LSLLASQVNTGPTPSMQYTIQHVYQRFLGLFQEYDFLLLVI